jgi:hypothetical protein
MEIAGKDEDLKAPRLRRSEDLLYVLDSSEASVLLLAHTERRRSAADRFPNGLAHDVDDETRRSND